MDFSDDVGLEKLRDRANISKVKFDAVFKRLLARAKLGEKRFL